MKNSHFTIAIVEIMLVSSFNYLVEGNLKGYAKTNQKDAVAKTTPN